MKEEILITGKKARGRPSIRKASSSSIPSANRFARKSPTVGLPPSTTQS
jgi:hypothetical protein